MSFFTIVDVADIFLRKFRSIGALTDYFFGSLLQYPDLEALLSEGKIHEKLCGQIDRYGDYMNRDDTRYLLRILGNNADLMTGLIEKMKPSNGGYDFESAFNAPAVL